MSIRPDWQWILGNASPQMVGSTASGNVVILTGTPRWTASYHLPATDDRASCEISSTGVPRFFVMAIKGVPHMVAGIIPADETPPSQAEALRVEIDGDVIGIDAPTEIGLPLATGGALFRLVSFDKMEAFWAAFNRGNNLQIIAPPPVDWRYGEISLKDSRLAYSAMKACLDENF